MLSRMLFAHKSGHANITEVCLRIAFGLALTCIGLQAYRIRDWSLVFAWPHKTRRSYITTRPVAHINATLLRHQCNLLSIVNNCFVDFLITNNDSNRGGAHNVQHVRSRDM